MMSASPTHRPEPIGPVRFLRDSFGRRGAAPAFFFLLVVVWAASTAVAAPNVIFILADDVGIGDLGPYGQQTVQTPHLDQLAADGLTFNQMYSGAPVCSPSRAILMTGLHNGRHTNGNGVALQAGNVTVAEVLKTQGYATGGFGKWHIGSGGQALPTNQGFDEYYGILDGVAAWDHFNPNMQRLTSAAPNTVVIEPNNGGFTDDLVGAEAAQFVSTHAQSGQPFYAQVNFQLAHFDMEVPELEPYTINQSWPESRKIFASMITRLDRLVGEVVAAVDDPNGDGDTSDSVADNTLILFASDNGTHIEPQNCCKGNHGPDLGVFSDDPHDPEFFDSNGPYRGWKRDLYDGGIKTPFIARWAGTVAPGQVNETFFGDFADFLPTVAELSGAETPVGVDGESFAHVLDGTSSPDDFVKEFQYFEGHGTLGGLPSPSPRRALIRDGYKAIQFNNGSIEIYDLVNDVSETNNLYAQNQALANEMIALATEQDGGQVQYRTWLSGDYFHQPEGWAELAAAGANSIATLRGDGSGPRELFVDRDTPVLAVEVGGGPEPVRLVVLEDQSLSSPSGVRVRPGGELRLEQAAVSARKRVELHNGSLTGRGTVTGTLLNSGRVAPDGASSDPPPPPLPDKALVFDFTGVQDDAPLTATSFQDLLLSLDAGFDFGPGTQPRSSGPDGWTGSDAGNEFNAGGFNTGSLASAIAADDYLGYTVSPAPGFELLLEDVGFNLWRNGGNAANDYAILTSADGFSAGAALAQLNGVTTQGLSSQQTFEAVLSGPRFVSGPLEVRLYGWNANDNLASTHVNAVTLGGKLVVTGAVDAIDFDFTGVQDDAPLTQTSVLHPNLTLVSGLDYGPSTQPRSAGPDGLTSTDAGNEFNAGGFDTASLVAAIAAEDYLTFTVQPVAGFEMTLRSVTFNLWRNGGNAANDYAILTSIDGFSSGQDLGQLNDIFDAGLANQHDFTAYYGGGQAVTDPVEVRLYAWNANDFLASTHVNAVSLDAAFSLAGGAIAAINGVGDAPIGVIDLDGDYVQSPEGTLQIDVGGTQAGVDYDQLTIAGDAHLDGTLEVALLDVGGTTFSPEPGDGFEVITVEGQLTGGFSTLAAPPLSAGLVWGIEYTPSAATLFATYPGDFDFDGDVDVADALEAQRLGVALDDWESFFGVGSALQSGAAVPEPAACRLLCFVLLACGQRQPWRR